MFHICSLWCLNLRNYIHCPLSSPCTFVTDVINKLFFTSNPGVIIHRFRPQVQLNNYELSSYPSAKTYVLGAKKNSLIELRNKTISFKLDPIIYRPRDHSHEKMWISSLMWRPRDHSQKRCESPLLSEGQETISRKIYESPLLSGGLEIIRSKICESPLLSGGLETIRRKDVNPRRWKYFLHETFFNDSPHIYSV